MGIYGALATAVSGLRAQAFALENISGNIANSQTTGYKRIDTSFVDLIPDAPLKRQVPGAVAANSRATNTTRGDIVAASNQTYMALNGSGFFVVEQKVGQVDSGAVFGGTDYYTRRGDFDFDKDGYLVNGAGYYLKGFAIDRNTGNVTGSVPEVIRLSNAFLPARATTSIEYALNLPELPEPPAYSAGNIGSELITAGDFMAVPPDDPAMATGATLNGTANANTVMGFGESLTITIDGTPVVFDFYDGDAGPYGGTNIGIDVQTATAVDIDTALAAIQTGLRANGGPAAAHATVGLNGGVLEITMGTNTTHSFQLATTAAGLGLTADTYGPTFNSLGVQVPTIAANDADQFLAQSIAGGAITIYSENGAPVNVQMRWAKTNSVETGGQDVWNLFYLTDGNATGSEPMWRNAGVDYAFDADGSLTTAITTTPLNNLTVNGVNVGNITLRHGTNGVTQFADANGQSRVTTLDQNGYGAGEFVSVAVNNSGRLVASYSNGQQIEVAALAIAEFNAPNMLRRLDGGIYAATSESGTAILGGDNAVIGAALENSNTDISEEFTKLIVTQQAYAANTRIVSSADEMLREALNMVR